MKRLLFLVVLMICSVAVNAQEQMKSYVVQSGETLFSISRDHGVTVDDIIKANKGLTEQIMAGQTILIPAVSANPQLQQLGQCKTTHVVQKKESITSIADQYGVTVEDIFDANPFLGSKIKKGTEICIPYTFAEKQQFKEQQAVIMQQIEEKRQESLVKYYDVLKIAVIAPFALNETRRSIEAQKITDFYKGFLMAVDSLKYKGVSCDIYAYEETGNDGVSINNVLNQAMLKHVNMIIGPFRPANVARVARFARENKIMMVTPMSTKEYDLTSYENIYEISAPQDFVYNHVYDKFVSTYSSQNIIFMEMNDAKNNVTFVSGLKSKLKSNGVPYISLNIDEIAQIKDTLMVDKHNLIIPSSGSEKALSTLCQKLNNHSAELESFNINLFGYPEWQTYSNQKSKLQKYNATFYTTFFANPTSSAVTQFNHSFTKWFRRDQVKAYPSYGLLGYDIGNYFIRGLNEYGSAFKTESKVKYNGLQTSFHFERMDNSGASLNNSLKFVRMNSDGSYSIK